MILALPSLKQLRLLQVGIMCDPEIGFKRLESHCGLEDIQVDGHDSEQNPELEPTVISGIVDAGLLMLSALKVLSVNLMHFKQVGKRRHIEWPKTLLLKSC